MPRYSFPGYTAFVEDAARQIGQPGAAAAARKITPLSALANLCAQAGAADPADVPGIMAKAAEFRDQLQTAFLAAELMLADVERALGLKEEPAPDKRAARPAKPPEPKGK